jgi:endonuclease G
MKKSRRRKIWKIKAGAGFFLLLLLYWGGPVGYYFLPWSVRKPIYRINPKLDRSVRLKGFFFLVALEGWGVGGRDVRAAVTSEQCGDFVCGGYPKSREKLKILKNKSYVVGYSESLRNPRWVAYRVFKVPTLSSGDRPSFKTDRRTRAKVSPGDYSRSGYDRGHMAPNFAIATRYGEKGQRETFLMSNIIPQTPRINRYIWKDLEMRVAKEYGQKLGEVWVITGSIFDPPVRRLKSGVAIPSAYYKIMADEMDGELRVQAFLIESDCPPYTRVKTQLVSVDEIEARTGLDFFPKLSESKQTQLEAQASGRLWPYRGLLSWFE